MQIECCPVPLMYIRCVVVSVHPVFRCLDSVYILQDCYCKGTIKKSLLTFFKIDYFKSVKKDLHSQYR